MEKLSKDKYLKQTKICPVCLKEFHNRAKWEKRDLWKEVKYCSDKCRKASSKKLAN